MRSIRVVRFRRRSSRTGESTLGDQPAFFSVLMRSKGDVVWQKDIQKEYPNSYLDTAGSPLIEGNLLIVPVGAKPDACVIAFDKNTGQEIWKSLDEEAVCQLADRR